MKLTTLISEKTFLILAVIIIVGGIGGVLTFCNLYYGTDPAEECVLGSILATSILLLLSSGHNNARTET